MRAIAVVLGIVLVSACVDKEQLCAAPESARSPSGSVSVPVQLNAALGQPLNGHYTLEADLRFVPPQTIQVVQGTYTGNPAGWLRANIISGTLFNCYYVAQDNTANELTLDTCDHMPDPSQGVGLLKGSTVSIFNTSAHGLLLEAHFTLVN